MEELLSQGLASLSSACFPAEMTVEYGQDDSAVLYLHYGGNAQELLPLPDSIADCIVRAAAQDILHTWTEQEGNLLTVRIHR